MLFPVGVDLVWGLQLGCGWWCVASGCVGWCVGGVVCVLGVWVGVWVGVWACGLWGYGLSHVGYRLSHVATPSASKSLS